MSNDVPAWLSSQFEDVKLRFKDAWEAQEDPRVLAILKGHLLLEAELNELISMQCANPGPILISLKGQFSKKVDLVRSLYADTYWCWQALTLLNSARNDAAHSLGSPRFNGLVKNYVDFVKANTVGADWGIEPQFELELSVGHVFAHLNGFRLGYLGRG